MSSNVNISLKRGDITEFSADVLVNALCGSTGDLTDSGAVSKAFVKAGGSKLIQSFRETRGVSRRIGAITPAYGNLNAMKIFYICIKRYSTDDPDTNLAKLKERIKWCISKAFELGLKSIAFPTLGCGGLGYPDKLVAKCFKEAAREANSVQKLQLTILSQKHSVCERFDQIIHGSGYHLSELACSDPIYKALTKILSCKLITIKGIYLVGNYQQYQLYERGKNAIRTPNKEFKVLTTPKDDTTLRKMLDKERNECYLLHGTLHENLDGILRNGFNLSLCNPNSLFGPGIYLAESFTKADQYSRPGPDAARNDKTRYMLIVRACLGTPHECKSHQQFTKPPPGYDSVICTNTLVRDSSGNIEPFREFLLFNERICYPEYLVKYESSDDG